MKTIAVVGSGVAGLTAAWLLSQRYDVHLFEAESRLGGHTHTHDVELMGQHYRVDSGFIVFNRPHYPLLTRLFELTGTATQPTQMSFSVKNEETGLEYNTTSLNGLFSQRRNLVSPRFIRMIRDLLRFYREAPALLNADGPGPTLGAYLDDRRYGDAFVDEHLLPMASALWSTPSLNVREYPAKYMVQFMANHQMLQADGRPQWRVVTGGSDSYISALTKPLGNHVHLQARVGSVARDGAGVTMKINGQADFRADAIVLACHSNHALAALDDASTSEHEVLAAMQYQSNEAVLHWDSRLLPNAQRAWAAWNALVTPQNANRCTVTYNMNILQSLESPEPLCVTLNRDDIDGDKVLARMSYEHPRYDLASVAAQRRRQEISGHRNTWYCGAYWGWGFHEDGVRSAVDVATALGVSMPSA